MMKLKYIFLLFIFIGVVLFACRKDAETTQSIDFGYTYFPNDVGRYIVYEVDSISYDDVSHPPDTTRYLLKEVIASTFLDNSNRPTLRIERFYKIYSSTIPYDSMDWVGPRVWFANRTSSAAEKVEENIRYIKLVFPVRKEKQWNGNLYNTLGEKEYEIISTDEPQVINSISFDSVTTVKQFENVNFIEHRYEEEKYSKNVGLIYKKMFSLYHQGGPDTVGYTFIQNIVSYGQ